MLSRAGSETQVTAVGVAELQRETRGLHIYR